MIVHLQHVYLKQSRSRSGSTPALHEAHLHSDGCLFAQFEEFFISLLDLLIQALVLDFELHSRGTTTLFIFQITNIQWSPTGGIQGFRPPTSLIRVSDR